MSVIYELTRLGLVSTHRHRFVAGGLPPFPGRNMGKLPAMQMQNKGGRGDNIIPNAQCWTLSDF